MDSRLLIEIYRQPTGELAAKFKHLQGDTEIDEEFYVTTPGQVSADPPEDGDEDDIRQSAVEDFFNEVLNTAQGRLFPEYGSTP